MAVAAAAAAAVVAVPEGAPESASSPLHGHAETRKTRFAGLSQKPSDGLEPSTPSLPWRCSTN